MPLFCRNPRSFCDDRYCDGRGAEGGVGPATGGGVPPRGPGSGAAAAFEPGAGGAGAGAASDRLSSGNRAGPQPDFGSEGVGNEDPSPNPPPAQTPAVSDPGP